MVKALAGLLRENKDLIHAHLSLGSVDWEDLVGRVRGPSAPRDEQLWTFLAACGYAIAGNDGVRRLTEILAGTGLHQDNSRIWLEAMPMSPRKKEGNTHLDLALGTIRCREGTDGGIELDDVSEPWICFGEAKLFSDLSHGVTHDPHRNQLARVAENALCFQRGSRYASRIYVALVTPKAFRFAPVLSRLYQYKFREYETNRWELIKDLDLCRMEKRDEPPDWRYPSNVADRVQRLQLRWVTYEELFEIFPAAQSARNSKVSRRSTGRYLEYSSLMKSLPFGGAPLQGSEQPTPSIATEPRDPACRAGGGGTSNKSIRESPNMLAGNEVLATAILDRDNRSRHADRRSFLSRLRDVRIAAG